MIRDLCCFARRPSLGEGLIADVFSKVICEFFARWPSLRICWFPGTFLGKSKESSWEISSRRWEDYFSARWRQSKEIARFNNDMKTSNIFQLRISWNVGISWYILCENTSPFQDFCSPSACVFPLLYFPPDCQPGRRTTTTPFLTQGRVQTAKICWIAWPARAPSTSC